MHLSLHQCATAQRQACAAFLRGSDPAAWLREIGRWNVAPTELTCYVVPESIRSVQAAGLLVTGPAGATWANDCLEPYGKVAERLYLPLHAQLWPATTPEELRKALLWPQQLFHPSIGLVGFADTDAIDLADLLVYPLARPTDWAWARAGLPRRPGLQHVRAEIPPVAEMMQSFQELVGTEPLAQLPGPKTSQDGTAQNLLDKINRGLLNASLPALQGLLTGAAGLGAALGGVLSVLPGLPGGASAGPGSSAGPTWAARLENWMLGQLADLEKKRESEIERLLRLFADNPEEALKYAIPLGSMYENRGAATPSALLGPRSTLFDLSRLGGGGRVDAWNVDAYRDRLRKQYQKAAEQEAAAGHYKKAAYIYAHLLGNYYQAAVVLEQGGYFREAAALHKDHLNNRIAAAECLERGGLLLEAIDLYVELEKHEKAGDLYRRMQQEPQATAQYEQCVEAALATQNHPEAARLLHSKLNRPDRALTTLLQGWHSTHRPDFCLLQYFELLADLARQTLSSQVRPLFEQHTPAHKRTQLLEVLATVNESYPDPELLHASREVAYEIISAEASTGVVTHLPLLKKFLPNDRLVASDCGRYANSQRTRGAATLPATGASNLDASIHWHQALSHRTQFLALGFRDGHLHLARGNWYGHVEYYSWPNSLKFDERIRLVADASLSNKILLFLPDNVTVATQRLPKNKYFAEELTVYCPERLPPNTIGLAVLPGSAFLALSARPDCLYAYRLNDTVKYEPFELRFKDEKYTIPSSLLATSFLQILYRNGSFYISDDDLLLEFTQSNEQLGEVHLAYSPIYSSTASPYVHDVLLAIATSSGTFVWRPGQSKHLPEEPLFDGEQAPVDAQFVGADFLVVVEQRQASLYQLKTPEIVSKVIEAPENTLFIAILTTSNRHEFALLSANGQISKHPIPISS
ncbi:hypothetical protein J0X19_09130 [Hymenobacter sp. BT186]|uniref:MoxR-vWA-beta-propeller ternary system domain-containing protein n=1 Tax=Hymenobacter telluris TaxID=2816474 RepID=A0A939J8T6_9BACT|nr:hypothetical protein [Hymenobacter telluris]MBO0358104.1 hypothetical protein [Hymenobacter telluris]MBW3374131.1 hypothetical protein [Hymenobacter norwichensis]